MNGRIFMNKIKLNNVEISQEDLIKEITGNKELMETLKEKFEKKNTGWFVPKESEEYYFLLEDGIEYDIFQNGGIDKERLERQQVFRTEEEAKKADQQRMAKVRILKRIAEENAKEGWVCDWDNKQGGNIFWYTHGIDKLELSFASMYQETELGFYMSKTVAEKLQSELLEDYKIMLGVE